MRRWRLLFFAAFFAVTALMPLTSCAHQSPNSLVFLDVSPHSVAMEIQMPVPELELAFGNDISKNPEMLIEKFGPQLKEYLKAHIYAYANKSDRWSVDVDELRMNKGKYIENGIAYWEVVAHLTLKPRPGESTRKFMLDYDVIMHQVINHVALISIRNDWETGIVNTNSAEAGVISWNTKDNVIYPYEINLGKGSLWKGFKSMLTLGMEHIREGTDHLLFLVVLLLPAMLLVQQKRWGGFGGVKYSLTRLLKIVTAFTIGHSITLLIGALGWLKLPQQPVEILIAISILVSAIHAVFPIFAGRETYIAAGFGLVHGLAFATVLSNLKLGTGELALSILGFNIGIELMQIFVIAIIIPWLMLLSKTGFYKWFRVSGALMAALAAIAWILERSSGTPNFITGSIEELTQYGLYGIASLAFISLAVCSLYHFKLRDSGRAFGKVFP